MNMEAFQESSPPKTLLNRSSETSVDEHDRDDSPPDFVKHSEKPLLLETSGRMSIRELNQQVC